MVSISGAEGGGKEKGLPPLGDFRQDRLQVLCEAHVQHLVGFVQDEDLQAA